MENVGWPEYPDFVKAAIVAARSAEDPLPHLAVVIGWVRSCNTDPTVAWQKLRAEFEFDEAVAKLLPAAFAQHARAKWAGNYAEFMKREIKRDAQPNGEDQFAAHSRNEVSHEPPEANGQDTDQKAAHFSQKLDEADLTDGPLVFPFDAWMGLDVPQPDFLLGELFSTTTRAELIGSTGIGKTHFGMSLGCHMAAGKDFLHWKAKRPARVLLVDGEMGLRQMKHRVESECKRFGSAPATFFIMSRAHNPDMPPLNTPEGQAYLDHVIDLIKPDFIIFDNVQALLIGEMQAEAPWADMLPWVRSLTDRSIGQLWMHHTGHDAGHGYGTKTREWQMDTVMIMTTIEAGDALIAFTLSFTKARERSPDNRADFDDVTIAMVDDKWTTDVKVDDTSYSRLNPRDVFALRSLQDCLARTEGVSRHRVQDMPRCATVLLSVWKKALQDSYGDTINSDNTFNTTFRRARESLAEQGVIAMKTYLKLEWVWLCKDTEDSCRTLTGHTGQLQDTPGASL